MMVALPGYAWGPDGHEIVTGKAIGLLPEPLHSLFEQHREDLIRFSNVPDTVWRREFPERGDWHYINMDAFGYHDPGKDFPRQEPAARLLYDQKKRRGGRLPWAVKDYYDELVQRFRERDWPGAIRNAGYLSHFAAESTQPLHVTKNYKGQETGNVIYELDYGDPNVVDRDIHIRFESGLVRRHRDELEKRMQPSRAGRISDPVEGAFRMLSNSLDHVQQLLQADKEVTEALGIDEDYESFVGKREAYCSALHEKLGDLLVERLELGAGFLADLWVSAWEEAKK